MVPLEPVLYPGGRAIIVNFPVTNCRACHSLCACWFSYTGFSIAPLWLMKGGKRRGKLSPAHKILTKIRIV
jgi:hypothetical protein